MLGTCLEKHKSVVCGVLEYKILEISEMFAWFG